MSTTKKRVLRDASGVSELHLPKWDKDGNAVQASQSKKTEASVVPTVTPDIEEETISAPTVKELEKIREDAFNEGFEQGYEQGLKQGIAEGNTQGLAQGLEQGREQGLAEGRESGHAQALAEGNAENAKALEVFRSVTEELQHYREQDEQEVEKALGVLAVRIARQVVQDELRTKPSHIKQVVHAAVQALPNPDEKLTIRINPIDHEFVTSTAETNWQIISDEEVSAGGCTVKSGFSYVDFTLEHRFELAVKQLMSHLDTGADEQLIQQPISDDYLLDNTLPETEAETPSNEETAEDIVVDNEEADAGVAESQGKTEPQENTEPFNQTPESDDVDSIPPRSASDIDRETLEQSTGEVIQEPTLTEPESTDYSADEEPKPGPESGEHDQ